jgi:prepilin-type N-terminal cleavage/methylation domain-containing protein
MLTLNNRGDTIVEVMVVLAVLGLAISISYATANRSLLNARQAQENGRATALAQSQVEQIRADAPTKDTDDHSKFVYRNNFCISNAGSSQAVDIPPDAVADPPPDPTHFPNECHELGGRFYNIVDDWGGPGSNDTFTVRVTWDDVLGQGRDSVTLSYRVHQDSP